MLCSHYKYRVFTQHKITLFRQHKFTVLKPLQDDYPRDQNILQQPHGQKQKKHEQKQLNSILNAKLTSNMEKFYLQMQLSRRKRIKMKNPWIRNLTARTSSVQFLDH